MLKSLELDRGAVGLGHLVPIACCWQGAVFIHTNDLKRLLLHRLSHVFPCSPCLAWLAGVSVSFGCCEAQYCCTCPCRAFLKNCLHKEC